MKTYEIVKLFDGYAVREAAKRGFFGKVIPQTWVNYFDVPTPDGPTQLFELGHTWSSNNPQFVKKYCIFKTIEDAESLIERLQTDEIDCLNPRIVKTVSINED